MAIRAFVIVFMCIIGACFSQDDVDVLKLTNDNFQSTIDSSDFVVVKFFAPWCGHCKKLAPEWAKAATILKKEQPPVLLAEVDATVDSELATRFGVSGYPTIKMFRRGVESSYEGPRDANGIVKYLRNQNGPAAKTIETLEKFNDLVAAKAGDVIVVAFFANGVGRDTFLRVANGLREDYPFYIVTDPAIIAEKNAGKNGIVLFRSFDGEAPILPFEGSLNNFNAIETFVKINGIPLAGVYTDDIAGRYKGIPRLTVFTRVDLVKDPSNAKYYLNRLRKAAVSFDRKKIAFVVQDRSSPDYTTLNFPADAAAGMAIIADNGKFKSEAPVFTADAAREFAQKYFDGALEQYIKSGPIPKDNSGPVKVVVAKTFQKEIIEAKEDVFIKFYAPWCGHCKQLAPKWEELGKRMSKYKTIKIVEVDATENDIPPQFGINGYPTLLLLKANDKSNPVRYNGDREVDAMATWLAETVSQPLREEKKDKKDKKDKKEKDKDKKKSEEL